MKASKQTKLKLRKGFVKAPISYRVLMVAQFTEVDMKEIARGLLQATTPDKAKVLLPQPGKPSKWSMRAVSYVGDYNVHSLHYKGLEVAAFWKRQTSEVIPAPSDPVPEGVLENPDDVWVRFDLLYKSARQLTSAVASDLDSLRKDNTRLSAQVEALNRVEEANGLTIKSLQGRIKALEAQTKTKTVKRRTDNGKGTHAKNR